MVRAALETARSGAVWRLWGARGCRGGSRSEPGARGWVLAVSAIGQEAVFPDFAGMGQSSSAKTAETYSVPSKKIKGSQPRPHIREGYRIGVGG